MEEVQVSVHTLESMGGQRLKIEDNKTSFIQVNKFINQNKLKLEGELVVLFFPKSNKIKALFLIKNENNVEKIYKIYHDEVII